MTFIILVLHCILIFQAYGRGYKYLVVWIIAAGGYDHYIAAEEVGSV